MTRRILISTGGGLLLGGLLTALFPAGTLWIGFASTALLSALALFGLLSAWRGVGQSSRLAAALIFTAFFLRLVVGAGYAVLLPRIGYESETQQAGYVFTDAYRRDGQAWQLAQSGQSLLSSFEEEFTTDQYGGLLAVSAGVYRLLSPDAHRPHLILILAAFFAALGVPFFYQALRQRWNEKLAALAAWVLVLYPDGVFFGSAQMREPFLIGLTAVALWAVITWGQHRRRSVIVGLAALLGMGLLSSRVAAAEVGVLALWIWLEWIVPTFPARWRTLGWLVLVAAALGVAGLSARWFLSSAHWDLVVTERSSGFVTLIIKDLGEKYRIPFLVGYGLVQPVLPAAIFEPGLPLMKATVILRSLGWYALAPLLLYSLAAFWRVKPVKDRALLVSLAAICLLWVVISSARAGGDMTDNPRYRTLFLPWMALLAAYAWQWARQRRDPWLLRFYLVELIFVGFFTHWYMARYLSLWRKLPFTRMVRYIAECSAVVLLGGALWDWLAPRLLRRL